MEDGNNTTTGGDSDAATVMDHLASVRSKLSLTTTEPTKRDLSKIGNLVSRVVKAHDGDRAASLALILAVIDWLPANTFWLRRVDSARRLADNWDQIANDWTVAQIERQRERDAEAHERDRRPVAQPTPVPERHSERHVHSLVCEHVLNDMRPHEDEYSHKGSLRYGKPSEWQIACMRHAEELNRRDGINTKIRFGIRECVGDDGNTFPVRVVVETAPTDDTAQDYLDLKNVMKEDRTDPVVREAMAEWMHAAVHLNGNHMLTRELFHQAESKDRRWTPAKLRKAFSLAGLGQARAAERGSRSIVYLKDPSEYSGEEAERLDMGSTPETLAKEWIATVPR